MVKLYKRFEKNCLDIIVLKNIRIKIKNLVVFFGSKLDIDEGKKK